MYNKCLLLINLYDLHKIAKYKKFNKISEVTFCLDNDIRRLDSKMQNQLKKLMLNFCWLLSYTHISCLYTCI